jgi:hypothetical protein
MLKSKYFIIAAIVGVVLLGGIYTLGATHQSTVQGVQTHAPTATVTAAPTITPTPLPTFTPTPTRSIAPTQATTQSGLSNDSYYTNSNDNQVHSPAYSNDNSVPAGATAQCGDGTYSFSQHRSGTCSHHGGVAQWL